MSALSRDNRAAVEFAQENASTRGLDPIQRDMLAAKTEAIVDWLKRFRRTLSFAARYPHEHVQRQAAIEDLLRDTVQYIGRFGDLEIRLYADHSSTAEGFRLPAAAEGEFGEFTFYPLFRDGITGFTIHQGVGPAELNLLLDVVASSGEREGDDAYTWLWRHDPPGLSVELAPSMTASIATALAVHGTDDPPLQAFLATLEAADPFYSSSDGRTTFSAETLEALRAQGVDPERARRLLLDPSAGDELPSVGVDAAARVRALYVHERDRSARLEALARAHGGGPR